MLCNVAVVCADDESEVHEADGITYINSHYKENQTGEWRVLFQKLVSAVTNAQKTQKYMLY